MLHSRALNIGETVQRINRVRAFTLLEVLVVVAIIALLVAILLPSLKRARQQGIKVACASNLHQLGLALHYYTEAFKRYPAHTTGKNVVPTQAVWPVRLLPYAVSPSGRKSGATNADVMWCPASPIQCQWDGKKRLHPDASLTTPTPADELRSFSYGYNDWGTAETGSLSVHLGLGAWEKDPYHEGIPVGKVRHPAEMFAIADNDIDTENFDKYSGTSVWDTAIDPNETQEYPGKRHLKGHNMLCADGHVEFILQSKNISSLMINAPVLSDRMRQRWNNDFKAHRNGPLQP